MTVINGTTVEFHNTLNPIIWTSDNQLKPNIRCKLEEIVEEFINYIDLNIRVVDAHIVGSNASYNYSPYSDLDLHIVINYDEFDAASEIVDMLMWAEKARFNEQYDLTICGINVEVYVEDVRSNTVSNGIYSLNLDTWIKEPVKEDVAIDEVAIDDLVQNTLIPEADAALRTSNIEELQFQIDNLYLLRKNGLATSGEFSVGNLAFKDMRNLGYLDKLKSALMKAKSAELSVTQCSTDIRRMIQEFDSKRQKGIN